MRNSIINKLKNNLIKIDDDIYKDIYDFGSEITDENINVLFLYCHLLSVYYDNVDLNYNLLDKAIKEDYLSTLKIIFYIRDKKEGLGQRDLFRKILAYLKHGQCTELQDYLHLIPKYGRWDDLFVLYDSRYDDCVINIIRNQLDKDIESENPSSLCKWLKSENSSSKYGKYIARKTARKLNFSYREYRKTLSYLRKKYGVVESKMSSNDWKNIRYGDLTNSQIHRYKNAFKKHDNARFTEYEKLNPGKIFSKSNIPLYKSNLYIEEYKNVVKLNKLSVEYLFDNIDHPNKDWIPVPLMSITDIQQESEFYYNSLWLTLYYCFFNTGRFKGYFINANNPVNLKKIDINGLVSKENRVISNNCCENVDIESVLDVILFLAIKFNMLDEMLPSGVLFICRNLNNIKISNSNICSNVQKTSFLIRKLKEKWIKSNYIMPEIKICAFENSIRSNELKNIDSLTIINQFSINGINKIIKDDDEIIKNNNDTLKEINNYDSLDELLEILNSDRYRINQTN